MPDDKFEAVKHEVLGQLEIAKDNGGYLEVSEDGVKMLKHMLDTCVYAERKYPDGALTELEKDLLARIHRTCDRHEFDCYPQLESVEACMRVTCPLYPYRMGKVPEEKPKW